MRSSSTAPIFKAACGKDEPQVIWEDEDILVLSKEAGWVVAVSHVLSENRYLMSIEEKSVEDLVGTGVREHLVHFIMLKWGSDPRYPLADVSGGFQRMWGIAHRIDVDTSGALLIGKTAAGYDHLRRCFEKREVYKEYMCLVHGFVERQEGVIEKPIAKVSGADRAYISKRDGVWAKSIYTVLGRYTLQEPDGSLRHFSLCKLVIVSGRTHQIRIHMESIKHPLVSDPKYNRLGKFDFPLCCRIFLHACRIGFYDLSGTWKDVHVPLTKDLASCIGKLDAIPLDSAPPRRSASQHPLPSHTIPAPSLWRDRLISVDGHTGPEDAPTEIENENEGLKTLIGMGYDYRKALLTLRRSNGCLSRTLELLEAAREQDPLMADCVTPNSVTRRSPSRGRIQIVARKAQPRDSPRCSSKEGLDRAHQPIASNNELSCLPATCEKHTADHVRDSGPRGIDGAAIANLSGESNAANPSAASAEPSRHIRPSVVAPSNRRFWRSLAQQRRESDGGSLEATCAAEIASGRSTCQNSSGLNGDGSTGDHKYAFAESRASEVSTKVLVHRGREDDTWDQEDKALVHDRGDCLEHNTPRAVSASPLRRWNSVHGQRGAVRQSHGWHGRARDREDSSRGGSQRWWSPSSRPQSSEPQWRMSTAELHNRKVSRECHSDMTD